MPNQCNSLSAPSRGRTCDLWFRRPVLCPLSYWRSNFFNFSSTPRSNSTSAWRIIASDRYLVERGGFFLNFSLNFMVGLAGLEPAPSTLKSQSACLAGPTVSPRPGKWRSNRLSYGPKHSQKAASGKALSRILLTSERTAYPREIFQPHSSKGSPFFCLCARGDSNSHPRRDQALDLARLPFTPRTRELIYLDENTFTWAFFRSFNHCIFQRDGYRCLPLPHL